MKNKENEGEKEREREHVFFCTGSVAITFLVVAIIFSPTVYYTVFITMLVYFALTQHHTQKSS